MDGSLVSCRLHKIKYSSVEKKKKSYSPKKKARWTAVIKVSPYIIQLVLVHCMLKHQTADTDL